MAIRQCSMSSMGGDDSAIQRAQAERKRLLIVPREHGAWGLLLVPMITGAGVGLLEKPGQIFPFVLLLTAALALFWLRTPVESLLGTSPLRAETDEERNHVLFAAFYLTVVATLALGMLFGTGRLLMLWPLAGVVIAAVVGQVALKRMGRKKRMLSEIVGTIGLTGAAAAAYYVVTGRFGATAGALWVANLLFAGDQIHYVQVRLHTARAEGMRAKLERGWTFAFGQVLLAAALAAAASRGFLPWLALVAFVPLLLRGWIYFFRKPAPLVVRRLGWSELAQAVVFCVLFIAAFRLGR